VGNTYNGSPKIYLKTDTGDISTVGLIYALTTIDAAQGYLINGVPGVASATSTPGTGT